MSNLSVEFNTNILALDTTITPNAYVANRLRDLLFAATASFYEPFFQVAAGATPVSLPAATIQVAWVLNLSATATITVSFTPSGGAAETLLLQPALLAGQPGGAFLYFNPATGTGGLTALSLTAGSGATPAEVLVAG